MVFCFGTVCWGGYLERYVDIFVKNYITIYRRLINMGVNHVSIANPKIIYNGDVQGVNTDEAMKKLKNATGKELELICDKHKYTIKTIMYSTRNRLRKEFKKSYPKEKKVFFYFPIDDGVRPELVTELLRLAKADTPTACMFKFFVNQGTNNFTAATRPINSYKDIHPNDWGGYCAYNILDESNCPLYPTIAIPNVAFYAELYQAGYKQYQSEQICIDHLRHIDSHHFKYKDTEMSEKVRAHLLAKRVELAKGGYK